MIGPTVVLIHGAWHVPQHYAVLEEKLSDKGIEVHIPRLPSTGDDTAKSALADDVEVVQKLINCLADEGKTIVVVSHSYGGVVATESLKDFSYKLRKSKGLKGGVLHIIYMCAYMIGSGESVATSSLPSHDPDPVSRSDIGVGTIVDPRNSLYGDLDDETAKKYSSLLTCQALRPFIGTISLPSWQYIPTTYLRCTDDRIMSLVWQDNMIRAAQSTSNIEVLSFKTGHSPFISMPGEMASVILGVISKYSKAEKGAL